MQKVRKSILNEFNAVNELIIEQLKSDVALVGDIGHYIVEAGGKRLRPILTLLTAKALGKPRDSHVKFAAVIEFIHTATLLHDDVVDLSQLRRGRPTANAEFGNSSSVLVGDFLYTRAFQLLVDIGNMDILENMANSTNIIAEGEVMQLEKAGDPSTTEEQYLDIINRKTATLFSSACFGAAVLNGTKSSTVNAMRNFGLYLGMAFQVTDDILDYFGDALKIGKHLGDDLAEGKMTLPLIRVMQVGNNEEIRLVREAITKKDRYAFQEIIKIIESKHVIEYCKEVAKKYRDLAIAEIEDLSSNQASEELRRLCQISVDRVS